MNAHENRSDMTEKTDTWPAVVYTFLHRRSEAARRRPGGRMTKWNREFAAAAATPQGAWRWARTHAPVDDGGEDTRDPADFVIVATRRTDEVLSGSPLYAYDWSETHDPQGWCL